MVTDFPDRIYLDNAATTSMAEEVLEAMLPFFRDDFGNPSSLYSYGREARLRVERARKGIAGTLGVKPANLIFTSGGTESDNMAIAGAVRSLGCNHILYPPTEHHAVLHAVGHYSDTCGVTRSVLMLHEEGLVNFTDLEMQLADQAFLGNKCLVCVMHANNETGVIADLKRIGALCRRYDAVFFSDCVQTIGHYPMSLGELPVDLASAAAHKFHGPKGTGVLYVREGLSVGPLIHGGGQERGLRAGTENVAGIVGLAKALEIAMRDFEKDSLYIAHLRGYLRTKLERLMPGMEFNGESAKGLYTVLSVSFPKTARSESLLLEWEMRGICVSGGSACSGGAGSHVMQALGKSGRVHVRFSFSRYNTVEEVERVVRAVGEIV